MKRAFLILSLIYCLISSAYAQKKALKVNFSDTLIKVSKLADYSTSAALTGLKLEISSVLSQLHRQAFITASIDSVVIDTSSFLVHLKLGKQYKWTSLKNNNIDEEILSSLGYRDKIYNNKPFNQRQLTNFYERIISFYENNGYPFASIGLDSIEIKDNSLSASFKINKNRLYKIDSVLIRGNATISDKYLKNYIKIKDGDLYNEELIRKVSTRIKELPFVTEREKFKVVFTEDKSKLLLNLKKKQASRFNGILGIVPDDQTGEVRLTGDIKLNLVNPFRKGEEIDFNWRAIQENTQNLNFKLIYPFIFNSPLGLDYNFKLYKRDTTYLDVDNNIGVRYILKGNDYFKLFFNNKSSSLLSQQGFESLTVLPDFADVSTRLYGLEFSTSRLDYTLNPRKGYAILTNGSLGNKRIKRNPQINEQLYENLNLKSTLYNFNLIASYYIPIKKRSVIKIGTQNGYTFNENLFENELLRIGGLLSLRGFDEESIFASFYTIQTIEYRFILEQNSFLYAFFDGAYYESDGQDSFISDRPFGFGVGMSFETRAGIFSVSYAVGKQFDNPILFRSAKIHFGFVNFF